MIELTMKIYYRWVGDIKLEIYIKTGRITTSPELNAEEMVVIYLVGKRVSTNKRGRLKKYLFNPPRNTVIGIGETWCWMSEEEKKFQLELSDIEFNQLIEKYDINKTWFL